MIEYKGYTIVEDFRNPYSSKPDFMYYPTEQGVQHDADYDAESYRYCGNCAWESSLDDAKAAIDDRLSAAAPDLLEAVGKIMESLNKCGSSIQWNTDSDIEKAYQLCKNAYKKATKL